MWCLLVAWSFFCSLLYKPCCCCSSKPVDAFSFLPLSLFGLAGRGSVGADTVLLSVQPLTLVLTTVRPNKSLINIQNDTPPARIQTYAGKYYNFLTNGMFPCPLSCHRHILRCISCHRATRRRHVPPSCCSSILLRTDGHQTSCRYLTAKRGY